MKFIMGLTTENYPALVQAMLDKRPENLYPFLFFRIRFGIVSALSGKSIELLILWNQKLFYSLKPRIGKSY